MLRLYTWEGRYSTMRAGARHPQHGPYPVPADPSWTSLSSNAPPTLSSNSLPTLSSNALLTLSSNALPTLSRNPLLTLSSNSLLHTPTRVPPTRLFGATGPPSHSPHGLARMEGHNIVVLRDVALGPRAIVQLGSSVLHELNRRDQVPTIQELKRLKCRAAKSAHPSWKKGWRRKLLAQGVSG